MAFSYWYHCYLKHPPREKRCSLCLYWCYKHQPKNSAKQNSWARPECYPLNMTRKCLDYLSTDSICFRSKHPKLVLPKTDQEIRLQRVKTAGSQYWEVPLLYEVKLALPWSITDIIALYIISLHKRKELKQIGRARSGFNRDWNRRK